MPSMSEPTTQMIVLAPDATSVRVGSLTVTSAGPAGQLARVLVDGKPVPARKLVLTVEVGKPITAALEWYPGFEFAADPGGRSLLRPVPADDNPPMPACGRSSSAATST